MVVQVQLMVLTEMRTLPGARVLLLYPPWALEASLLCTSFCPFVVQKSIGLSLLLYVGFYVN